MSTPRRIACLSLSLAAACTSPEPAPRNPRWVLPGLHAEPGTGAAPSNSPATATEPPRGRTGPTVRAVVRRAESWRSASFHGVVGRTPLLPSLCRFDHSDEEYALDVDVADAPFHQSLRVIVRRPEGGDFAARVRFCSETSSALIRFDPETALPALTEGEELELTPVAAIPGLDETPRPPAASDVPPFPGGR